MKNVSFRYLVALSAVWSSCAVMPVIAATITVNDALTLAIADDGLCTLTEAVVAANSNAASGAMPGECAAGDAAPVQDVIAFDPGLFPAHFFTFSPLELNESIHIQGPGSAVMSVTNLAETRVFEVQNLQVDAEFVISGMTLRDNVLRGGTDNYGAALEATLILGASLLLENLVFFNNSSERGGGALSFFGGSDHEITVRNSTFENNLAGNFGDGNVIGGGAIFIGASQRVTIENSSFIGNSTFHAPLIQTQDDAAGGAILIRSGQSLTSTVEVIQSTFSGNTTTGTGGAIGLGGPGFPADQSELTVRHSTIVLNESDSNQDETALPTGGGIWSSSSEPVQFFNSIVALNTDNAASPAPDLHGSSQSFGYNLIGDNSTVSGTFPAGQPNPSSDLVGTAAVPLDPRLEALADLGGPTPVHQPMILSPLIDQGRCSALTSDQRLFHNPQTALRIVDVGTFADAFDGCDIGSVERFGSSANPVPQAVDDSYVALEDQVLVIDAEQGLLVNDIDDDPLVLIEVRPQEQSRLVGGDVVAASDGSFTFTNSNPDSSGLIEFVSTISDGLNTATAQLLIDVLPVNDAPEFLAASTTVSATAGQPVVLLDWATEVGAGPSDEQGQSLQFDLSPVDVPPGFFAIPPSLDVTDGQSADLSFQIADDITGNAVIRVVLRDDGGTENGGVDRSPEVLLTVQSQADQIFQDQFHGN